MLELVNLSNYKEDSLSLFNNDANKIQEFLETNKLDGLEMFFCEKWQKNVHKAEFIYGVHLPFYNDWLDFWYGNENETLKEFKNKKNVMKALGGLTKKDALKPFIDSISLAVEAKAEYVVFHVSNVRKSEIVSFDFKHNDKMVITTFIEFFNKLLKYIPKDMTVFFENLWWPGLTLLDRDLVAFFIENIKHENKGIMLDTGHLLNTNFELKNEYEAVDYILNVVGKLGDLRKYIRGIHLHHSLSGKYVKKAQKDNITFENEIEIIEHILKIDNHLPFETKKAKKILELVNPDVLVHEFAQNTREDWQKKINIQRDALR